MCGMIRQIVSFEIEDFRKKIFKLFVIVSWKSTFP